MGTMLKPAVIWSPQDAAVVGRRTAARLRLAIPARMLTIHGIHDCILLDLSRTGARIALTKPLPIGSNGFVAVAQIEAFGEVIRREMGESGGVNAVRFDDPLEQADVLAVRHHAETFLMRERETLREQVRRWVAGEM